MANRMTNYDRFQNRYNSNQTPKTFYICLEETGARPRTEIGAGKLDRIIELSKEYEPANKRRKRNVSYWKSPFVILYFKDKENDYHASARVAIPNYHEDVSRALLDYIDEVKTGLVNHMKQQNPGCTIRGAVALRGSNDNVILNMMKKFVNLEEVVKYEINQD
jgi:hypothetical protein